MHDIIKARILFHLSVVIQCCIRSGSSVHLYQVNDWTASSNQHTIVWEVPQNKSPCMWASEGLAGRVPHVPDVKSSKITCLHLKRNAWVFQPMDNSKSRILKMQSAHMLSSYWEMVSWVIKNSSRSNGVLTMEIWPTYVCTQSENPLILSRWIFLWLRFVTLSEHSLFNGSIESSLIPQRPPVFLEFASVYKPCALLLQSLQANDCGFMCFIATRTPQANNNNDINIFDLWRFSFLMQVWLKISLLLFFFLFSTTVFKIEEYDAHADLWVRWI